MNRREQLQELLESILSNKNVYFQPPDGTRMNYPAIVYGIERIDNHFADNVVYGQSRSYEITVIDKDPESKIADAISKLPRIKPGSPYCRDNLYHTRFTLFY